VVYEHIYFWLPLFILLLQLKICCKKCIKYGNKCNNLICMDESTFKPKNLHFDILKC
jgi:hypothetical protein